MPSTGPPPFQHLGFARGAHHDGRIVPRVGVSQLAGAAFSTQKKKVMKRLLGHLAQVALLSRVMNGARLPGSSASTCTRACSAIIISDAGMPLPETSPSARATRPSG